MIADETQICKNTTAPKTEEDRLRLRILQLEAEVAYLEELRKLRLQEEARQRKLSKS